ncbi:SDR family oxidoreductase [Anderseniella sp. Alg231-50]|uniref:SDR family oxidoreductase n=1 Tax=Anderseniella sp. Alg231-50 TaxID=1922226 RepID=UPI000D55FC57
MRLAGKKALITGAARGIGLGCAKLMVAQGCDVVITDIDVGEADRAAGGVSRHPAIELDVTSRQSWNAAITQAEDLMHGINVLINNAGIIIPGTVEDLDETGWDRTMDVDLKSVYLGCQAALPVLSRNAPASIINIASISSMIASANFAAYNAAKAGVHMLTKSVALHAARAYADVRCNSVHPAFVDTDMVDQVTKADDPEVGRSKLARQIPLGRIATVDDVAWAVVYLASNESSFMTGSELKLDGGVSAM